MGHNWQTGETITAANLNALAVVADMGTAGTPTGDALRAAYGPGGTAGNIDAPTAATIAAGAAAGLALVFGA